MALSLSKAERDILTHALGIHAGRAHRNYYVEPFGGSAEVDILRLLVSRGLMAVDIESRQTGQCYHVTEKGKALLGIVRGRVWWDGFC